MVKKLFALASVSALTGLVAAVGAAGCTTEETTVTPETDSGVADAKKDSKGPVDEPDEEEPPATCAAKDAVDLSGIAYTKALAQPGACTTKEVADLTAYFAANSSKNPFKISDWATSVSDGCAACVFTESDAAAWGPILVKDDQLDGVNFGGCVEIQSGKEACGEAWQQLNECTVVACLPADQGGQGTCTTQDEFDECRNSQDTLQGPCGATITNVQKECGSGLEAYLTACDPPAGAKYIFEGTIPAHCITGGNTPDAGE